MKVKNVIKGLLSQGIKKINILSDEKVIFSGDINNWKATSVDMILYKKEVENYEVTKHMTYHEKAFIFVAPT